jgi:hypothetical protein
MDAHRPIMPCQQPVGTTGSVQCFATWRLLAIVSAMGLNDLSDTAPVRMVLMRMP